MSDTGEDDSIRGRLGQAAHDARAIDEDDSEFGYGRLRDRYTAERDGLIRMAVVTDGAVDALAPGLHHEDPYVRVEAASALGNLFAREAVPHLTACQRDPDERVRRAVQDAIQWINQSPKMARPVEAHLPPRIALLCAVIHDHPNSHARMCAINALTGMVEAAPALAIASIDGDTGVRDTALRALTATPCDEALRALCAAVQRGDGPVAIDGVAALWRHVRSDAALEAVLAHFHAPRDITASQARWALARMAAHESDARRRTRLVEFVQQVLSTTRDPEIVKATLRIAISLADARLAAAVVRFDIMHGDVLQDALDVYGEAASEALVAASRDPSRREQERETALRWAAERGLITPPPVPLRPSFSTFMGRWRDREGRALWIRCTLQKGSDPFTDANVNVEPAPGGDAHKSNAWKTRDKLARVGPDNRMRFTLEDGPHAARYTLRRQGHLIMADVELLGPPVRSGEHPFAWLTPTSPFQRADLPALRA